MLSSAVAYRRNLAARFGSNRGATMVEYAIMLGLIAVASVLVIGVLGFNVFTVFDTAQQEIDLVHEGPDHCDHPHAISPVHC